MMNANLGIENLKEKNFTEKQIIIPNHTAIVRNNGYTILRN